MKLSTLIMILLAVTGYFVVFGLMSDEARNYYPDAQINDSAWNGQYNYTQNVSASIEPLEDAIKNLGDENTGWFSKIISGIAAIPYAVIAIPSLIFSALSTGTIMLGSFVYTLNVNPYILILASLMILVWIIIKLIEIYQRWQI